ncbi:hypothetical protein GCM10011325_08700 [Dyadobacter sediminis]|nr:hypothetical protein GCM10011325_08700 [Dyadobacter sediminis]
MISLYKTLVNILANAVLLLDITAQFSFELIDLSLAAVTLRELGRDIVDREPLLNSKGFRG